MMGTSHVVPGGIRPGQRHPRYADAPFVHGPLAPAQAARATARSIFQAVAFRTVVRREEDKRRIHEFLLVERFHQPAEGEVELGDVAVVLAKIFGHVLVRLLECGSVSIGRCGSCVQTARKKGLVESRLLLSQSIASSTTSRAE